MSFPEISVLILAAFAAAASLVHAIVGMIREWIEWERVKRRRD